MSRKVQRNYKKHKAVNHIGQMHRVIGVVLPFLLVSKREADYEVYHQARNQGQTPATYSAE